MIQESELRQCIDLVKRIEAVVSSIEAKLAEISEDLKADLEGMRERDFWEEYQRYMNDQP